MSFLSHNPTQCTVVQASCVLIQKGWTIWSRKPTLGPSGHSAPFVCRNSGRDRGSSPSCTIFSVRNTNHANVLFLDHLRSGKRASVSASAINRSRTPKHLNWDDVDDRIKQAVAELAPPVRETFLLSADGMNYREIATASGAPVGTVMSELYRERMSIVAHMSAYSHEQRWATRNSKRHSTNEKSRFC